VLRFGGGTKMRSGESFLIVGEGLRIVLFLEVRGAGAREGLVNELLAWDRTVPARPCVGEGYVITMSGGGEKR